MSTTKWSLKIIMIRIQLDLPEAQVAELDKLMKETGILTRKDLFNNALTLFEWAVKQKRARRLIASVEEDKGILKELLMPVLENVKPVPPGSSKREEAIDPAPSMTEKLGAH